MPRFNYARHHQEEVRSMKRERLPETEDRVLYLFSQGLNSTVVAARMGIPRRTALDMRKRAMERAAKKDSTDA